MPIDQIQMAIDLTTVKAVLIEVEHSVSPEALIRVMAAQQKVEEILDLLEKED